MPPSPSESSDVRRFVKLMQRANDTTSAAAERAAARESANKLFESSDDVRTYVQARLHAQEQRQEPRAQTFDASAAMAQVQSFLKSATPLAADVISFFNVIRTRPKASHSRASLGALVDGVDFAGRVFDDGDDDDETVIVTVTVPASVLVEILHRAEQSQKAVRAIGDAVLDALDATVQDGAYGTWPFGDDEEEA